MLPLLQHLLMSRLLLVCCSMLLVLETFTFPFPFSLCHVKCDGFSTLFFITLVLHSILHQDIKEWEKKEPWFKACINSLISQSSYTFSPFPFYIFFHFFFSSCPFPIIASLLCLLYYIPSSSFLLPRFTIINAPSSSAPSPLLHSIPIGSVERLRYRRFGRRRCRWLCNASREPDLWTFVKRTYIIYRLNRNFAATAFSGRNMGKYGWWHTLLSIFNIHEHIYMCCGWYELAEDVGSVIPFRSTWLQYIWPNATLFIWITLTL